MAFKLATLNGRGLNSQYKWARFICSNQHLDVDRCRVQETHFIASYHENYMPKRFRLLSVYFDMFLVIQEASLGKSECNLFSSRLYVLDLTIKESISFRKI